MSYTDSKDSAPYEAWRDSFRLKVPSKFNFAYDVLGAIAADRPGATALVTCDDQGASKSYTFGEIEQASNRAASFFLRCGLRKGDAVLLLLRRRPEFWFALLGLHKIGAVAVPGTHLLTAKDIAFRVKAADIRMIVAVDSPFLRNHISEAEEMIDYIDALGPQYVACLDVGHSVLSGSGPADMARKLGPRLELMHAHENNGLDDCHMAPMIGFNRKTHSSAIDWAEFAAALKAVGYRGMFSLEPDSFFAGYGPRLAHEAAVFLYAVARQLVRDYGV